MERSFFPFNGDSGQMLHTLFTPLANVSKLVIFFGVQHHSADSCIQILIFFFLIFFGVYVQVHEETYTDWNEKLEISKFHFLHLICYRDHRVTLLFLTNKHKLLRINAKQQKFPTSTQILLKQKSFSPSKNLIKKLLGIISICLYLFISLPGRMRTKM